MLKGPRLTGKAREWRGHFVAAVGEFVGTFLFLWFAYAWHLTAANQAGEAPLNKQGASAQTVVFISMAYGFPLLSTVWIFYRISGGLFNPSVALGLGLIGAIPWIRVVILIPTQLLAGMAAAGAVSAMFPGDIAHTCTTLGPDTSMAQGLFIEMFLTCLLVLTVFMLAVEKSRTTFIAPLAIGLAVFVAELAGVYYTGGSLNLARSLGPAVAGNNFTSQFWVYVVGPWLGSVVSAGFYYFLKYFHFEDANPGQDSDTPATCDYCSDVEESTIIVRSKQATPPLPCGYSCSV